MQLAVDDKHVANQYPPNSGTVYVNYKKVYIILRMAIFDANYRFLTLEVEREESAKDT